MIPGLSTSHYPYQTLVGPLPRPSQRWDGVLHVVRQSQKQGHLSGMCGGASTAGVKAFADALHLLGQGAASSLK